MTSNNSHHSHKFVVSHRDGYVILVGVLVMGAVAVSVATSIILLGIGSSKSSFIQQRGYLSQSIADACAEIALQNLIDDPDYDGEVIDPFAGGSCTIDIDQPCTDCILQVVGQVGEVIRRTKVTVTVGGGGGGGGTIGSGTFPIPPATFTYSASGSAGNYTITVRDNDTPTNQAANETFIIAATDKPIISTSDNRVNVGDVVSLDGEAFTASGSLLCTCGLLNYCVELTFNSQPAGQCDYTGTGFTDCSFTIPPAPYGRRNLTGTDDGTGTLSCSGQKTSEIQVFLVEPKVTATACSGTPKQTTITGTGFAASSDIFILWENADTGSAADATTNSTGGFSATFTLPVTGTHKLGARDSDTPTRNYAQITGDYTCVF